MRRKGLRVACLAVIGAFTLHGSPVDAGGNPFNGFIAKSKKGTYRSSVIDTDQPADNPQKYTKKVEPGDSATFFVKVKNSGQAVFNVALEGDLGAKGFDVQYFIGDEDVTDNYGAECQSTPIPAGGKVLIKMKVTAHPELTPGADDEIAFVVGDDSSCFDAGAYDIVWAIVKVV